MEVLQQSYILNPEEEVQLELDALLGAFEDRMNDDSLSHEEGQARDALIFSSLKATMRSAESMQNIRLLQTMSQQLEQVACTHDHFAQQLDAYGVFGSQGHDEHASHNQVDGARKSAEKGKKNKKKRKKPTNRGWLRWLDGS
ncbi:MAG TPA: hypothetical protein VK712_01855 [Verrucomicrobiae bacterium]|jgi:hypothetical protein|nr:hypothetical protein [Verrucomicrobiae bacterium]